MAAGTLYNRRVVLSVLIPAAIVAFLGLLIAAGVFILQKVRSGQRLNLSFRTIAAAYFHLMAIACFLVMTVGIATALKAGLSDAFGRPFSYYTPPVSRPTPEGAPSRVPPPEDRTDFGRREVDRQYQNDLIQGVTLAVVGAVLWGLHTIGRREVTPPEIELFFSRAYSTVLLAIFGPVGVVFLPTGLYELLRYLLVSIDDASRNQPGASVATALVFVPIWMYYLMDILKRTRWEATS